MRDANRDIQRLVRAALRDMSAYQTAPSEGCVKLDAMESPWPPPAALRRAWCEQLQSVEVNRYPSAAARALRDSLREFFDAPESAELLLGNGSDELIQLIALLVGGEGRVIMAPSPSFVMFEMTARAAFTEFVGVPLKSDFSLDARAMLDAIKKHQPACIFLARPNNPSGNCFDSQAMTQIINAAPGLVVVDEAYHPFCAARNTRGFLEHLAQHSNLLVLRTLSKNGLAGLRLGALIGAREWLRELEKIKLPYNINALTQHAARFYLQHGDWLREHAEAIVEARESMMQSLRALPRVQVFPSEANFILCRVPDADAMHQQLLAQNILVKNLHKPDTALENCLRVTIGAREQNAQFLAALGASL